MGEVDKARKERFGKLIIKLRKGLGMSQLEFAAHIDVVPGAVCAWEKGKAFPKYDSMEVIAGVLKTTVRRLLLA